jgi:toxin ParE1/3/4
VTVVSWTDRALADLAAVHAFVEGDSPHYAAVVVRRLLHAVDRLQDFPLSGRIVPEYDNPLIREVAVRPYRVVYRVVGEDIIHVLTVHHAARGEPDVL